LAIGQWNVDSRKLEKMVSYLNEVGTAVKTSINISDSLIMFPIF
jgi:hypothetical protein